MKKSRRTYNGVHLNKKSNTQDVVEQSLTIQQLPETFDEVKEMIRMMNKEKALKSKK